MDMPTLKAHLNKGVVKVTFTKINGDLRVMTCTTNPDLIPPDVSPKGKVTISEAVNERTVRAFDVNAQGWRSFIMANVTEIVTE
jgi:hypothetical protein